MSRHTARPPAWSSACCAYLLALQEELIDIFDDSSRYLDGLVRPTYTSFSCRIYFSFQMNNLGLYCMYTFVNDSCLINMFKYATSYHIKWTLQDCWVGEYERTRGHRRKEPLRQILILTL
jgi:hypothetical protein